MDPCVIKMRAYPQEEVGLFKRRGDSGKRKTKHHRVGVSHSQFS